jgi:predicted RNA binding protein YcfA (HicA-like mRNA interferase family)
LIEYASNQNIVTDIDFATKKWYHMGRKEKLLKKFLVSPPKKDLTFEELDTLLQSCGFVKLEGKGSAVKFYHHSKDILINLHKPHPSNILKHYLIRQIQPKLKELCDG